MGSPFGGGALEKIFVGFYESKHFYSARKPGVYFHCVDDPVFSLVPSKNVIIFMETSTCNI